MGFFTYEGAEFCEEDGIVVKMHSLSVGLDIEVPKIFPQGFTLINIPSFFASGSYGKISFDADIRSAEPYAFGGCFAREVVWPEDCLEIPSHCFDNCRISKISNIEKVEKIGASAFNSSNLEEIVWPGGCDTIPDACFYNSSIKRIYNAEHVTAIGHSAFSCSSIESFHWPSGCNEIPKCCFAGSQLKSITNIDHVASIGRVAFADCRELCHLDLSALICNIECNAFKGVDSQNITLPYYESRNLSVESLL